MYKTTQWENVAHGNGNERFRGCRGQVSMPSTTPFEEVKERAIELGSKYIVKASARGTKLGNYYIKCIPTERYSVPGEDQVSSQEIEEILEACRREGIRKGSTSWVLHYE
tara:strand:- start:116 stop:445 length:330 start_codon:yes stop_codon:yes gene_type:complete